jgi:hypothetical protein
MPRPSRTRCGPAQTALQPFAPNNIFVRNIAGLPAASNQVPAENMAAQMKLPATIQPPSTYSPSLYIVPGNQHTQKVTVPAEHVELQEQCEAVPVPTLALIPSGSIWTPTGTDKWVAIWQPSTDKWWEFFGFAGTEGAWTAVYGGYVPNVSSFNGILPHFQGARATSLSLIGGMISIQDLIEVLEGGTINHALGVNLPVTKPVESSEKGPIAPATRCDEQVNNEALKTKGVAESNWFYLTAHTVSTYINLATEPLAAACDQAMQTYGFFVCDSAGGASINIQSMQHAASPYSFEAINPFAGMTALTAAHYAWNVAQYQSYAGSLLKPSLPLLTELPTTVLEKIPFALTQRIEPRSS